MQKHKTAKKSFIVQPDGNTWILYKLRGCRHTKTANSNNQVSYLDRLQAINKQAEIRNY